MSQEQAVLFAGEDFGLVLCRMATVLWDRRLQDVPCALSFPELHVCALCASGVWDVLSHIFLPQETTVVIGTSGRTELQRLSSTIYSIAGH